MCVPRQDERVLWARPTATAQRALLEGLPRGHVLPVIFTRTPGLSVFYQLVRHFLTLCFYFIKEVISRENV